MGLLDILSLRKKTTSASDLITMGLDDAVMPERVASGMFRQSAPPPRGSWELVSLFKSSPWLRAPLHKIGYSFASIEWFVYAEKGSPASGRTFVESPRLRDAGEVERRLYFKRAVADGKIQRLDRHPFMRLWNRPNPLMSGRTLRHIGQIHLDLLGETYLVVDTDAAGVPQRLWVIPPTWVKELPTEAKPVYTVDIDGTSFPVPVTNMIVIRDPDPANPWGRGAGVGMSLTDEVDVDEYAAKHVASWFHNKGMPDMIVSLEGAGTAVLKNAKAAWDNAVRGFAKAYRTHWTGAKLNIERLDTAFKDMALVELRTFARNTLIQTIGVPPEKLGIIEHSNRSTSESSNFIFANDVLVPRAELWRTELQMKLVERYDERLLLDYVSPVPGDREFQRSVVQAFADCFTIDEIRDLANMEPLPEGKGKGFLVTQGKSYVDDLSKLSVPPVYGYHLAGGILTNNEARSSLGLEPAPGPWGDERTVGLYVDPNLLMGASPDDESTLPPEVQEENKRVRALAQKVTRQILDDAEARGLAKKALPPARKTLSSATIEAIINSVVTNDLAVRVDPVIRALVEEWGQDTIEALDDSLSFNMDDPAVQTHVREYAGDRLGRLINTTTRDQLRAALDAVVADGKADDKGAVVAAVRGVFDKAEVERSDAIAETEVRRSSMFSTKEAMSQSGIVVENEWLSTKDGRAREEHLAMDGQRRALDAPFEVTLGRWAGAKAMHPGGFGIAALDINCRCVVGPVVVESDEDDEPKAARIARIKAARLACWKGMTEGERAEVWRALDRKLQPWDARYARAIASGFRAQERAAIDAVESAF